MNRKSAPFFLILALPGLLIPVMGFAADFAGTGPIPDHLVMGFQAWVQAFEADVSPDTAWEYPYGAPGASDLSPAEFQLILGLRRNVQSGDLTELESLADKAGRLQGPQPSQLRFWLAYAQRRLDLDTSCLQTLKTLLETSGSHANLDNGQRAWVLTGTADLLFLSGERALAAVLYHRLADSSSDQLTLWANYQLAGMDFLKRSFDEAGRRYGLVCASEHSRSWREHACAMAEISEKLQQLRKDSEPDGQFANLTP